MGRSPRYIPRKLGYKLATIRERLGIESYEAMIEKLDAREVSLHRSSILRYEKGQLEPPSIVLLRYARLAGVSMEDLVDDSIDLSQ